MFFKHLAQTLLKLVLFTVSSFTYHTLAAELPEVKIAMGKQQIIHSKTLAKERSLFIRLPENYEKTNKRYPVLYLLDANSFYVGNIYQEAVTLISRLEKLNDIPELIIVGVQSEQWYKDVITDSKPFENYVNQEVVSYIDNKYRTLPQRILMGHSYAGAFVSSAVPVEQRYFDLLLSLSPIYPSMGYIDKIRNRYRELKQHSAKLVIIDGDESPMDKLILKQAANKVSLDILDFSYLSKKLDGHMSVVTIGLSHGLREFFSDFRFPSRQMVATKSFDIEMLKSYYTKKDKKYATKTDKKKLKSLAISMAHRYTSMGKLKHAIPFWRFGESRFKEYFMNGYVDRFIDLGKQELAIELLVEMQRLFPDSEINYSERLKRLGSEEK